LGRILGVAFVLIWACVVFLVAALLVGVLTGQMFDPLTPPLSPVPLAGTLQIGVAAGAAASRACHGDRRHITLQ
jgi:hypothetical protein